LRLGFKGDDAKSAKIPPVKRGKLNTEMLALVSAIIKYIDEADMNAGNKKQKTE
jgi:hypothetical protein